MGVKIIVTGATSMIGVAVIKAALKDTNVEKILAVIRPNSEKSIRLPENRRIKIIECDFGNYESLLLEEKDYEAFYHLAWSRTATYQESYEDILLKCLSMESVVKAIEVAHKMNCKRFVWAGSQAEYGIVDSEYIYPTTVCDPVRVDGILHLAAGKIARILCNKYNIPFIWNRIFSIYGENDRIDSMISQTVRKMLKNEHCEFTDAEQIWDYLHADDMGNALYLTGKLINSDKIYCIGSGDAKPLKEYIRTIRNIINPNLQLVFGELKNPVNPVKRLCPDITDIVNDTGWKPEISFEEGIKRIVKSIEENE